jgi:hypothetical protein
MMKKMKNCACVIHGDAYSWNYVERLYNMLKANSTDEIRLHVFTESNRVVPPHMVKHELQDWPGVGGPKKAWWYKMQMFNSNYIKGRVLYFDLDTVITKNIDWMWNLSDQYFWAIRDFKYLWRTNWRGLNSSVMLWDTQKYHWIWDQFMSRNINATIKLHHGDQDFLNTVLDDKNLRFFNESLVKSWRWQIKDGGLDMKTRQYKNPNAGSVIDPATSIMIFHGRPKPHEIMDPVVDKYWQINTK